MRMLSTQTFNDLKLSSHLSQRRPLSVILSSINISQQSQLMQISSKNAPVCSTLISTLLLPPSDRRASDSSLALDYRARYQVFV